MMGDIRLGLGARKFWKEHCLGLGCWFWFWSAWEAGWNWATHTALFPRSARTTPWKVCPTRWFHVSQTRLWEDPLSAHTRVRQPG